MADEAPEAAGIQVLDLTLSTPDGELRARVAVPRGPMRLAELAFNVSGLDQQLVGLAVKREEREGRGISCSKGCAACCRHAVSLSPPEAWMISDLVASAPAPRRERLLQRFADIARTLEAHGFRERLMSPRSDEEVMVMAWDYFRLRLDCPFLEEEMCSIYAMRPMICREYVVTSPAENCSNPFVHPVRVIAGPVRLSKALARLTAELLGGEPQSIPLVLAPAWVEEHREDGRKEWPAKMLLERLLAILSGA